MKQENSEIGKKVLTDGLDHCKFLEEDFRKVMGKSFVNFITREFL